MEVGQVPNWGCSAKEKKMKGSPVGIVTARGWTVRVRFLAEARDFSPHQAPE
jgi:hypothetical protein